jgi:hypothetical protein
VTPYERLRALPGIVQLTGAAAIALVLGALMPWLNYSGTYASGVSFNSGELCVVIGVLVIYLLTRATARGGSRDSGGIAALALLAVGVIAVLAIHYGGRDEYGLAWGLWVTGAAAVLLLVAGLGMLGSQDDALGPPD